MAHGGHLDRTRVHGNFSMSGIAYAPQWMPHQRLVPVRAVGPAGDANVWRRSHSAGFFELRTGYEVLFI